MRPWDIWDEWDIWDRVVGCQRTSLPFLKLQPEAGCSPQRRSTESHMSHSSYSSHCRIPPCCTAGTRRIPGRRFGNPGNGGKPGKMPGFSGAARPGGFGRVFRWRTTCPPVPPGRSRPRACQTPWPGFWPSDPGPSAFRRAAARASSRSLPIFPAIPMARRDTPKKGQVHIQRSLSSCVDAPAAAV